MITYNGLTHLSLSSHLINKIFEDKNYELSNFLSNDQTFQENEYVHIQSCDNPSHSALFKVKKQKFVQLKNIKSVSGISPRNIEQVCAIDALIDLDIKVVILTGRAGTGKTLLALAGALKSLDDNSNEITKMILTKPMTEVGKNRLGILPGDVGEKFNPYLQNYMCNLVQMVGEKASADLVRQYDMEFLPLQLILGASWSNSFVIADEVQTLSNKEMVALGTRVGENSKLVLMGDLGQRHEKIAADKTGLHKIIESDLMQKSSLVASIHLQKCERGAVAALFADVFGV